MPNKKRISIALIACMLGLSCSYLIAQPLPESVPESVGLSTKRLDRLTEATRAFVDEGQLAGIVTMIARKGRVVYFDTYGRMSLEENTPMRKDAIFRIYSMTKPITTVAAMMLFEEGRFQLDDPVAKYIPEFEGLHVYSDHTGSDALQEEARPMTISDLMTHRAGLTYGIFGDSPVDRMYQDKQVIGSATLEEMIAKLSEIPLLNPPGETWHYSVATDVLGYLVEVLSGQSLDTFFEERIFKPLGMTDTGFFVPVGKQDRFTTNYRELPEGGLELADHPRTGQFSRRRTFLGGGGGLTSTISDYMRFSQMLLNGGELAGVRLLGSKTVDIMTANHLKEGDEVYPGYGFGLGFRVCIDAARANVLTSEGEYGWGGLAKTYFFIDPEEELIGIFMTQIFADGPLPTDRAFRTGVYQAIID